MIVLQLRSSWTQKKAFFVLSLTSTAGLVIFFIQHRVFCVAMGTQTNKQTMCSSYFNSSVYFQPSAGSLRSSTLSRTSTSASTTLQLKTSRTANGWSVSTPHQMLLATKSDNERKRCCFRKSTHVLAQYFVTTH